MPLDPAARDRVIAEAKRRGIDPQAALAAAEKVAPKADHPSDKPASDAPARPIADRLLIGFLPFIKVRELRALWQEALNDRRPGVAADEALDRLERKYQSMVGDAAPAR
mgnify:CR=1 FL=1